MILQHQKYLRDTNLFITIVSIVAILGIQSCSKDEAEAITPPANDSTLPPEIPTDPGCGTPGDLSTVDPKIVGSWWTPIYQNAFSIDEIGNVTYFKVNQLTGLFEKDNRFIDKIKATNGAFMFVETANCSTFANNCYSIDGQAIAIPINQGYFGSPLSYLKVDLSSENLKRPESFIKAKVEINGFWGQNTHDFDASGEFDLMELLSPKSSSARITAYEDSHFNCNLPISSSHYISMMTIKEITGTGTYDLFTAGLTYSGQEDGHTYGLSYRSQDLFVSGSLNVTEYSETDKVLMIIGTFEFNLKSEHLGIEYPIYVKDGEFKLFTNR